MGRERKKRRNRRFRLAVWTVVLTLIAAVAVALTVKLLRSPQVGGGGYSVRISEVSADNTSCPDPRGVLCDFVELENTSGEDFDLSGYYLSDEEGRGKYRFPAPSVIPAHGYLVVWCDSLREGEYAPFSLKKEGGETVCLMTAGQTVMDRAVTIPCAAGQSLVRGEDGAFSVTDTPTPGYANTAQGAAEWQLRAEASGGAQASLSEIMTSNDLFASPDGSCYDWVEVVNPHETPLSLRGYRLSDRSDKSKFDFPNVTLAGGETLVIWCGAGLSGETMAPFALSSDGGETVVLTAPSGLTADSVTLPALEKNTSYEKIGESWQITDRPTPGYGQTQIGRTVDYARLGLAITEVMEGSKGFAPDADGDFSDWIELGNLGREPIELEGWYLSDTGSDLTRTALPARELAPGEYIRLWASGKDREGEDGVHLGFSLAEGETVYLTAPDGQVIQTAPLTGAEEGASLVWTKQTGYASCDNPTPGCPNTPEGYAAFCESDGRSSPLLLWEIAVYDPAGNDWVELKNVSRSELNLSDYTLTDKKSEPARMRLPDVTLAPGESTVVELEDFGLSARREGVYLYDSQSRPCDWAFLRGIPLGGSYGRQEGENGFFYFTEQTPLSDGGQGWRSVAARPTADVAGGLYPGETELTVTLSGQDIYYTTDGSAPTTGSEPYRGPIPVSGVTVLRAASLPEGQLGSEILTETYFLGDQGTLPVVSLVAEPSDLFGARGLYDAHETAWREKWEREATVAFYEEDGSFSTDCGVRIHGRTSRRASTKRSFTLFFRGRYGGELKYDVFGDGLVTEFSSLLLRASLEDVYTSHIRDTLFARLAMDNTDVPAQNYRFVSLYINGEYWGLYAIRERHSADYFASHTGAAPESVDMQTGEFRGETLWAELMDYAEHHDLSDPAAWAYIREHLDVPEMIDWLILECWGANADVNENARFYASPDYNEGRYVYGLADMDLTMTSPAATFGVGFYQFGQFHSTIPRALLSNSEFRDMFLTRLGELLNGGLSDQAVLDQIEAMEAIVAPEAQRDLKRWNKDATLFNTQMRNLKTFASGRRQQLISAAMEYFSLSREQAEAYFG